MGQITEVILLINQLSSDVVPKNRMASSTYPFLYCIYCCIIPVVKDVRISGDYTVEMYSDHAYGFLSAL